MGSRRVIVILAMLSGVAIGGGRAVGTVESSGLAEVQPAVATEPAELALPARLSVVQLQTLLARRHFSPGLIDGKLGKKTRVALDQFLISKGLEAVEIGSGGGGGGGGGGGVGGIVLSDAARAALFSPSDGPLTLAYRVTEADLALVTGPIPEDWLERAALEVCGYADLHELLAERGWCSMDLVQRLNPDVSLNDLKAGDEVVLPNVPDLSRPSLSRRSGSALALPKIARIEIDLAEKLVRGFDASGTQVSLMHCSIARAVEKRPVGELRVKVIATEPEYTFDPADWPEVEGIDRKLRIAPGPRNPVGSAWIGLDRPGYGLHGTVRPQDIGKTGSHGCFRLANWDAARLARAVKVGTIVDVRE